MEGKTVYSNSPNNKDNRRNKGYNRNRNYHNNYRAHKPATDKGS